MVVPAAAPLAKLEFEVAVVVEVFERVHDLRSWRGFEELCLPKGLFTRCMGVVALRTYNKYFFVLVIDGACEIAAFLYWFDVCSFRCASESALRRFWELVEGMMGRISFGTS